MIGGVLVERTVAEVLPALEQNKDQVIFNLFKIYVLVLLKFIFLLILRLQN